MSELHLNAGASVQISYIYSPAVACFAAGTWIDTASGPVAVEHLSVGMQAVTAPLGTTAPIVWIGHRDVDCRRHPKPETVWPVRVRAGAFAAGVPSRDLLLSPDHAVFCEDVLIPVRLLVNGTTVVQEKVDRITYYHIELDHHALLLAEGLPVESFLDTGNRSAFANGGDVAWIHPDFAPLVWEGSACAPLVVIGAPLQAARERLAAVANNGTSGRVAVRETRAQ
ncbi:MAG: Hint domain-containing protein [Rhodopila sp.]|nr:Hint domain-containing protein [Rhodopila sp.]